AAKRAALTHVIFNLVGTIIFVVFLGLFTSFVTFLQSQLNLNPEMTLAFAHGSFNLRNTIIQFPFIGALAWLVTKIVPVEDTIIEYNPKHLDSIFIEQSSTVALDHAKSEIIRMVTYACSRLAKTKSYLNNYEKKHSDIAIQIERALNNLDRQITKYLINVSKRNMSEAESAKHTTLMDTVRDIERIGDHFENIIELIDYKISNKVNITEHAQEDLNHMFELTIAT